MRRSGGREKGKEWQGIQFQGFGLKRGEQRQNTQTHPRTTRHKRPNRQQHKPVIAYLNMNCQHCSLQSCGSLGTPFTWSNCNYTCLCYTGSTKIHHFSLPMYCTVCYNFYIWKNTFIDFFYTT